MSRSSFSSLACFVVVVVVVVLSLLRSSTVTCAPSFERCKVHDEPCILRVANDVLQNGYGGNASIGLAPLDPLRADVMRVKADSGPVEVEAALRDFDISGFSKGAFTRFRGFSENSLDIRLKVPKGVFRGLYSVSGRILLVPVTGEGTTKTIFHDLDLVMKLPLTRQKRENKTFLAIVNPQMTFELSGGETHLSHLSALSNKIINWSFNIVISAVKDVTSEALVEIFAAKINRVFDRTPYEELFIE